MPVNEFYKAELRKLQSFEKALKRYQSYQIPDANDSYKIRRSYAALLDFGEDFSSRAYYKLYKKYGDPNKSAYTERLRMHLEYSKEISWFLMRNPLSAEQYNILVDKFQSLDDEYKNHQVYLQNTFNTAATQSS